MPLDDFFGPGIHQHRDTRLGKAFAQTTQNRRRQDDISDIPKLNDEDTLGILNVHQTRTPRLERVRHTPRVARGRRAPR